MFLFYDYSSHMTQPVDVAAFGIFKKETTSILTTFAPRHDGKIPVKADNID